jgi:hypothetical protein
LFEQFVCPAAVLQASSQEPARQVTIEPMVLQSSSELPQCAGSVERSVQAPAIGSRPGRQTHIDIAQY